jgi:hypothetical protein
MTAFRKSNAPITSPCAIPGCGARALKHCDRCGGGACTQHLRRGLCIERGLRVLSRCTACSAVLALPAPAQEPSSALQRQDETTERGLVKKSFGTFNVVCLAFGLVAGLGAQLGPLFLILMFALLIGDSP